MTIDETLIALEEEGWRALSSDRGAAYYRDQLTEDALMLLPGAGLLSRDAVIEAIEGAPPWAWFRIEEPRVMRLTEDSAIVTYRASAQRAGQPEYGALISTAYVRRDGAWMVTFHQQTSI
jgi:hypothetical protein